MEYDADGTPVTPEPCTYETIYLTSHKGACRAAAFSNDGLLFATGSEDSSIKILDVDKIVGRFVFFKTLTLFNSILLLFRSKQDLAEGSGDAHHPVIRTLYDHISVSKLFFHL